MARPRREMARFGARWRALALQPMHISLFLFSLTHGEGEAPACAARPAAAARCELVGRRGAVAEHGRDLGRRAVQNRKAQSICQAQYAKSTPAMDGGLAGLPGRLPPDSSAV